MSHDRIKRFLAETGPKVGKYEVVREIGRGGMSVVMEAHDPDLDRKVAVKVLKGGALDRLRQEATAAARLRHPNIVVVHEVGPDFIVMDLVEGRTLAEAQAGMSPTDRCKALVTVAHAVEHAHGQGVIHRDLKPANVLIGNDGRILLADFGLAKVSGGEDLTETGAAIGTPHYMSPEQVKGREVGPAADVWSLGVLLYELVAGRRPFDGQTSFEIFEQITRKEPAPLAGPLGAIAGKALEKDPARRYPSAAALAEDVERFLRGESVVAPRLWPRLRRRLPVIGALAIACAIAAVAVNRRSRDLFTEPYARWRSQEDALDRKLERDPRDLRALLDRGELRRVRGDYAALHGRNPFTDYGAAGEDFGRAIAIASDPTEAYFLRGRLRSQIVYRKLVYGIDPTPTADCAGGEEDLTRGITFPLAANWRGSLRLSCVSWRVLRGEDVRTELAAAEADLTPPRDADAFMRRGHLRDFLGRYDEADRDFAESLRLRPGSVWALTWRGIARVHAADHGTAERYLSQAIEVDPNHAEAWQWRGESRLARGLRAEAIADLTRAIELNPALEPQLRPKLAITPGLP